MRKWVLTLFDVIGYGIPFVLAATGIITAFLSEQQKAEFMPGAVLVAPIVAGLYLVLLGIRSYRTENAIDKRESLIKSLAICMGKGEGLKSEITYSWTNENARKLLGKVEKWESDVDRVISKYHKELVPLFQATSEDREVHFDPGAESKLDLTNRMIIKLKNLSRLVRLMAGG